MIPILSIVLAIIAPQQTVVEGRVEVQAVVTPDTVGIGERFGLIVSLRGLEPSARIAFPEMPDSGAVVGLGPPAVLGDRADGAHEARYELTAWSTGELTLPEGEVRVESSAGAMRLSLPATTVYVTSVLPATADIDSLAYRPPADVVGASWSLLERSLGAGLLLVSLLALLVYGRRRSSAQPVPIPAGPAPKERALEALERLGRSGLIEVGELKAFYSELSEIIREFLAESVPEWGRDLTTRELLTAVDKSGTDQADVQLLTGLLESADLVKFARTRPSAAEAARALGVAQGWISEFEPVVEEPEPEAAAEEPVLAELEDLFRGEAAEAVEGTSAEGVTS